MDDYSAFYYIISSHTQRHVSGTAHIWYARLKIIKQPRHLVVYEDA